MADSNISLQGFDCCRAKNVPEKPQILAGVHPSLRSLRIRNSNAAGFLTPVLKSFQTEIDRLCYRIAVQVINSENAAFFSDTSNTFAHRHFLRTPLPALPRVPLP